MLLHIKADWAELAHTFGFPQWGDGLRPCFLCNSYIANMYKIREKGWRLNQDADYHAACARCEIHVVLHVGSHALLLRALALMPKKGMVLVVDVPALGLLKNDRLEPCPTLPDVCSFSEVERFPFPCVFWRTTEETLSRHRNPVFDDSLGVTITGSLTIDTLHAQYLGNIHGLCKLILWKLLRSGLWGELGTQDQQVAIAMLALSREISAFYKQRRREKKRKLTCIQALNKRLLGAPSEPTLKTKGAETWGLLLFLTHTLRRHMHRLPPDFAPLLEAATCLENLMQIFDEGPVRLPDATVQRCWELYARFCEMTDHLDELLLPKRHLFAHLLEGLGFRGNPKFYANWRDEGLNKLLRSSCRHQSQSTFDSSILVRMDILLEDEFKRYQQRGEEGR